MREIIQRNFRLLLLLAVVYIVHSILAIFTPLNGDEALYWEWSRHLALGYYSHPPMTAWIISLFVEVFGLFKYTVRLGSIALHLGTIVFIYLLALDVSESKKHALFSVIVYIVMPISLLKGTAITTESSLVFFFTAAVFFTRKAIINGYKPGWYIGAVMCGGMLLTKFFAILFFPGVFLFLLVNKKYRAQIATKEPYLATLTAFVLFSPFLYWNMKNDWLTFQFNLVARHGSESGSAITNILYYIGGQLLATSPVIMVSIVIALITSVLGYRNKINGDKGLATTVDSYLLLSYVTLFPLLFFLALSWKVKVGSHWPGIIYPVGSVVVSAWILGIIDSAKRIQPYKKKTYWSGVAVALLMAVIVSFVALFPKVMPDRLLYTPKVYDNAPVMSHFFGWKEVGIRIDQLKDELEVSSGRLYLSTRDYAIASMLGFYTPSHPQFYLSGVGKETFHGKSFLIWAKGKKKIDDDTLFVSDVPNDYERIVTPYFKEIRQLEPLVVRDEKTGGILRVFYFTLGIDFLGNEPDVISIW